MTTSELIKKLCEVKNISLSELARRLGQSPQNFGKKLKRETVTLEELTQIAELTGVSFEQNFVLENGDRISTDTSNRQYSAHKHISENSENDLKAILDNISHSFRNPLNTIVGFSDMVCNSQGNFEKLTDYAGKIKLAANRMTGLVDNMREMASIANDTPIRVVDSKTAIKQFNDYASEFISQYGVPINYELKGMGEVKFYCNTKYVNRVINIILTNAISYASKDKSVDLLMERNDPDEKGKIGIRCTVINKWDCINSDALEVIKSILEDERESFNWLDFDSEQLEIAIVRKYMNHLGGKISMSSDKTSGTKVVMDFVFDLVEEREENPEKEMSFAGRKILVVEDNDLNSKILSELLGVVGIVTEIAVDGVAAVERFQEVGPCYYDAVLMDIQMPRMDGYEATKRIREICGDTYVPIIAVTANAFEEDRQKSIECGLDAHMSKPVDYNKLLILLKKFIFGRAYK